MNEPHVASQPAVVPARPGVRERLATFLRDHFCWMLSLFLVGLGAKLWLILQSGTPLPYWDQWDGEAEKLFIPYFEGHLTFASLFSPHNEHRIFFTKIYALALVLLNGQWDNQLEMVGDAIIQSATLAGLGALLARLIGKAIWPFIWLPLVLALALPFAWENTLCGFQSQFYFLVLFSLITIWVLGLSRPLSARWWLGTVIAVAALFTTASGFLATDAVVALAMLNLLKDPRSWRESWPTFIFGGIITIAGLLLKHDMPAHHILQAHSIGEFIISLGNNLAWPWIVLPPYAPCNLFPLFLIAWFYLRSRDGQLAGERLILGLGLWVGLQAAAAAYARGAGGGLPYWRYMDNSSFTMIANAAAIGLLWIRYRERLWPFKLLRAGFIIWAVCCLAGLALLTSRALQIDIPEREFYQRMQLRTTRDFLATDDLRVLNRPRTFLLRPDSAKIEATLIRNPVIRTRLPACVRAPLKVAFPDNHAAASTPGDCIPALTNQPPEPVWGFCPAPGSSGPRKLESQPVQKSNFPYLEFPVAGGLGSPGLALECVNVNSGRTIPIKPSTPAGAHWSAAEVRAPAGEFKIVARNESATGWFAFQQPRELGRLSYWAIQILRAWKYIFFAGIVLLLLNITWLTTQRSGAQQKAE